MKYIQVGSTLRNCPHHILASMPISTALSGVGHFLLQLSTIHCGGNEVGLPIQCDLFTKIYHILFMLSQVRHLSQKSEKYYSLKNICRVHSFFSISENMKSKGGRNSRFGWFSDPSYTCVGFKSELENSTVICLIQREEMIFVKSKKWRQNSSRRSSRTYQLYLFSLGPFLL